MKAKNVTGFVLFLAALLLLWIVAETVTGISNSIERTWTPETTTGIADSFGFLLKFGGIVFICLLALAAWNFMGGVKWSNGGQRMQLINGAEYQMLPVDQASELDSRLLTARNGYHSDVEYDLMAGTNDV